MERISQSQSFKHALIFNAMTLPQSALQGQNKWRRKKKKEKKKEALELLGNVFL